MLQNHVSIFYSDIEWHIAPYVSIKLHSMRLQRVELSKEQQYQQQQIKMLQKMGFHL